jgi:hypothetical protein
MQKPTSASAKTYATHAKTYAIYAKTYATYAIFGEKTSTYTPQSVVFYLDFYFSKMILKTVFLHN